MKGLLMSIPGLVLALGCSNEEGPTRTADIANDAEADSTTCTRIQGREVDLERNCTIGIVEIACVEVDRVYALTGHECRVSDDGRVFVGVTAPSYLKIDGYTPCPAEMGVITLGGYTEQCSTEPDE